MEKVLVIGGGGFLGSHVADQLSNKGYEVILFDIKPSIYQSGNQKMIVGDIVDREAVNAAVKQVDIVYHFAAIADIHEAKQDPVKTANFNILGTINILEACRTYSIKRLIYSSTIYVYSQHGSFYRSSKQACELFIENYKEEYQLNFTILRYGSLYGKRANHFNFIHNSIKQALLEGKITRNGNGEEIRDYINIVDAAKASVSALDEKYKNSFLMISGHQSMRVNQLLFMIKEIMNNQIEINYVEGSLEGHYKITPFSFKPKVALKMSIENPHEIGQGILDTIYTIYQDLLDNGESPKLHHLG
jgi:UDP-glucose 4-epimerase